MADENMERAAEEAREALTAIRSRLENGVNWMMHGRNTGKGIGVADMRALIQFIDAHLEAEPDDDEFNLFVARAACGNLGALVDDFRAALEKLLRAEEKYVRDTGLAQPDDLIQSAVNEARALLGWPALGVRASDGGTNGTHTPPNSGKDGR